jgi:dTDP-glucose pyrophosphorylase
MIKNDLLKYQICNSDTIYNSIQKMNKAKIKLLFVIDKNKNFLGTISDGDIRRATANNIVLTKNINKIFNQKPITVNKFEKEENIKLIFKKKKIFIIPIVNNKKIIGYHNIRDFINDEEQLKPCPVLIMAGGYGKRLYPLTKKIPKPMLPIKGKPLLEIILRKISRQGFFNFYISTHFKHKVIKDYFKDGQKYKIDVKYIYEKNPTGTAGALKLLRKRLKKTNTIILMNSDILTDAKLDQLLIFHKNNKADMTIVVKSINITNEYGVVKKNGIDFHNLEEKPTYVENINAGIYAINIKSFEKMAFKSKTNITDIINYLKKNKKKIIIYPLHEKWIDIGNLETYKKVK